MNAATARATVAIAAPKGSPLPPRPPLTAIVTPTVAGGGNRRSGMPRFWAIRVVAAAPRPPAHPSHGDAGGEQDDGENDTATDASTGASRAWRVVLELGLRARPPVGPSGDSAIATTAATVTAPSGRQRPSPCRGQQCLVPGQPERVSGWRGPPIHGGSGGRWPGRRRRPRRSRPARRTRVPPWPRTRWPPGPARSHPGRRSG